VIQSYVAYGHGIPYSFCVVVAVAAFGLTFPVYLNLFTPAMKQVDPIHKRRHPLLSEEEQLASPYKRFSNAFTGAVKRKSQSGDAPRLEHAEKDKHEDQPHNNLELKPWLD
jgi:hypothetical protein